MAKTFIHCNKAIIIKDHGSGCEFSAVPGFLGYVDDWVREHWYFKALCKDGTITEHITEPVVSVAPPAPLAEPVPASEVPPAVIAPPTEPEPLTDTDKGGKKGKQ